MSYASLQQLTDRYGADMLVALTDRAVPSTGLVDAAVVARALADTDALIDGHLMARYLLPLAPAAPPLVVDLALAIAIHKLHRETVSDKIAADHKDALRMLGQIAGGSVRLDVLGVEPAASGSGSVRMTETCRPLTADSMKGFI